MPVVRTGSALPEKVEVVVVGGGVVGLSTALSLARRGHSVVLLEKGRLGGEQSTRNWGWCRHFGRDPRELPLAEESMRSWRDLAWPDGRAGIFRPCGIVYLARTPERAERYADYLDRQKPSPEVARPLTEREVARLLPELVPEPDSKWALALYMPGEGRADPDLAVARLASAAERSGACLLAHCAARGLETTAGRVSAVVTEHGRISCDSVVVAAGAWSSMFCRRHGLTLPLIKVVSSVLATHPVEGGPSACVFGDGFAFGRQRDGSYLVGHGGVAELPLGPDLVRFAGHFLGGLRKEWNFVKGYVRLRVNGLALGDWRDFPVSRPDGTTPFERRRVLDPPPSLGALDESLARLRRAFPAFSGARVRQRWAGAMDVTPDALPVISTVPVVPGLVIGAGFSGHGFGISPAVGVALADLATGRQPQIDVAPFRLSRFFDGTPALPSTRF